MTRVKFKLASIALTVALAHLANAQETHALRLAIEAGKTLAVTTVSSTKMAFTGPMDQTMETKTTMVQNYKFDKGPEGWLTFDVSVGEFKMEGDAGMPGMAPDADAMVAAIKKVKLGGQVNNLGKTKDVKMSGDTDLDMMTKGMMAAALESMNQVGFMAISFPEAPVGVGSKWKTDFDMAKILEANGGGFLSNAKGVVPMEFEVLAFEDVNGKKTAKIQVFTDGKVTFDSQMGGSGTMSTTSKGSMWLDLATGLIVKTDTKMANNIDIGGQFNISQDTAVVVTAEVKG